MMSELTTLAPLLNSSTTGQFHNGLYVLEDYNQRIIIGIVFVVISIVGIIGNSLVILAIAVSRKLRNATNSFVVNLACADLLTCLCLPFNAVAMLSITGWHLPGWICAVVSTVALNCLAASVLTLAFIAFNRWYLLGRPREMFQKLYTPRNIALMIVFAWLYPFLLIVIPHFAGFINLGYSYEYKICALDTAGRYADYYSMMAGLCVVFPAFAAILIIYIRIYRLVARHEETMQSTVGVQHSDRNNMANVNEGYVGSSQSVVDSSEGRFSEVCPESETSSARNRQQDAALNNLEDDTSLHSFQSDLQNNNQNEGITEIGSTSKNTITPRNASTPRKNLPAAPDPSSKKGMSDHIQQGSTSHSSTEERLQSERSTKNKKPTLNRSTVKVTKKLAIIIIAFVICTLPFGIGTVVPPSRPAVPWNYLLLFFNSCLNPVIYARTMRSFREIMGCLIRCRFDCIPEPVEFVRRLRRLP